MSYHLSPYGMEWKAVLTTVAGINGDCFSATSFHQYSTLRVQAVHLGIIIVKTRKFFHEIFHEISWCFIECKCIYVHQSLTLALHTLHSICLSKTSNYYSCEIEDCLTATLEKKITLFIWLLYTAAYHAEVLSPTSTWTSLSSVEQLLRGSGNWGKSESP